MIQPTINVFAFLLNTFQKMAEKGWNK